MEIWRDVEHYEGLYQVSDYGNVRSLDRFTTGKRNRKMRGSIALFEADGGMWKLDAKSNIINHLVENLKELIEDGKVIVTG